MRRGCRSIQWGCQRTDRRLLSAVMEWPGIEFRGYFNAKKRKTKRLDWNLNQKRMSKQNGRREFAAMIHAPRSPDHPADGRYRLSVNIREPSLGDGGAAATDLGVVRAPSQLQRP
jgi:hypothetical protein